MAYQPSANALTWGIKPAVFIVSLLPLAWLVFAVFTDRLGANPLDELNDELGEWALRFLILTLAITPLRKLTGMNWLIRLRRMLGLYVFFYAVLHLFAYLWLDKFFYWPEIIADVIKRPFITVGMLALFLLIPLAVTSTNGMMKRLGRWWARLHKLIYVIAVLAFLHFLLLVKFDTREPLIYGAIIGVLLFYRLVAYARKRGQGIRQQTAS